MFFFFRFGGRDEFQILAFNGPRERGGVVVPLVAWAACLLLWELQYEVLEILKGSPDGLVARGSLGSRQFFYIYSGLTPRGLLGTWG